MFSLGALYAFIRFRVRAKRDAWRCESSFITEWNFVRIGWRQTAIAKSTSVTIHVTFVCFFLSKLIELQWDDSEDNLGRNARSWCKKKRKKKKTRYRYRNFSRSDNDCWNRAFREPRECKRCGPHCQIPLPCSPRIIAFNRILSKMFIRIANKRFYGDVVWKMSATFNNLH